MSYQDEYIPRVEDNLVPDTVKSFAVKLDRYLRSNNVVEVLNLYEGEYNEITERYYKASPWPEVSSVSAVVDDDENFIVLYRELYYRHIYAKLETHLQDRLESFQNYINLFNIILGLDPTTPEFTLPHEWLWDMIDEFVYQFQSFHQYRSKTKDLEPEEAAVLQEQEHTVVRYLHALVKKAKVDVHAHAENLNAEEPAEDVAEFFHVFAHFAVVGLARVYCLLGDYPSALRVLSPIDLTNRRSYFHLVTACHASLYYYMGFAYLMTRRTVDAVKTFSSFLLHITRHKQSIPRNYQQSNVLKTIEKMHALLAISVSLSSQRLEEGLHTALREKFGDRMQRMQKGDVTAFSETFTSGCPKFISCAMPKYEDPAARPDATKLQLKVFLQEIEQRQRIPDIYSHLKLCTAVDLKKLSTFLETDEDTALQWIMSLKHKASNLRWQRDLPIHSGVYTNCAEVDFYLERDTIHIGEYAPARRYGDFFIRNILKFEDLTDDIRNIGSR